MLPTMTIVGFGPLRCLSTYATLIFRFIRAFLDSFVSMWFLTNLHFDLFSLFIIIHQCSTFFPLIICASPPERSFHINIHKVVATNIPLAMFSSLSNETHVEDVSSTVYISKACSLFVAPAPLYHPQQINYCPLHLMTPTQTYIDPYLKPFQLSTRPRSEPWVLVNGEFDRY